MRILQRLLFLSLLTMSYSLIWGQRFGGNPASIKWKQINTDTFRIIYPEGLDSTAQRIANVADYIQKHDTLSIGSKIWKINIVLQSNSVTSNGYVGLSPYRSEYYLMPPQNAFDLGAQRWGDNLAIHEYRHVQQYSNFKKGLPKVASILFGQDGLSVLSEAAVPNWFYEGDAVYNETMFSTQGRGRLPSFFNGYKSLYYAGKKYNYMQLRNGSLKNYIPDHYRLGYLLVAYGREKYGDTFWKDVTQDAVHFRPLVYPFQGAVKRHTGIEYSQFVDSALSYYQQQWKNENKGEVERWNIWSAEREKYNIINYNFPYKLNDYRLLMLKTSQKTIPTFYSIIHKGLTIKIRTRDISPNDNYYSYNNGRIVYSSYKADLRWGYKDYANIKILDVNTGKQTSISHRTKYFSPDISPDGSKVATIQMQPEQSSSIVLMNADGNSKQTLLQSSNEIYSYPKFSADNKSLFYIVRNRSGEMGMNKYDLTTGTSETILPLLNRLIGFPVVDGDTLTYTCTYNGHDEAWAYVGKEHKHYRLATYRTGIYQSVITNSERNLVGSTFTANGYSLKSFKPLWEHIPQDSLNGLYLKQPFGIEANNALANIPQRDFPVSKYRKSHKLLNIHSWWPYYDNSEFSFNVYGENVLGTLQSKLYYLYDVDEGYSKVGYTGTYAGWYVEPIVDVSQTWQRTAYYRPDTSLHWNEFNIAGGLQLPLNFSGGRQYRYLTLSSTFNHQNVNWTGFADKYLDNTNIEYLQTRIQYSGQIQSAPQHIYPHWAQTLLIQYRNAIDKHTAHQFLVNGNLYLRGLRRTHNLVFGAAYQRRDTASQYSFTNNFPFSRGYNEVNYPEMWRLSVNYHFPLWYPDWGIGNIVFIQRLRANLYYDYLTGKSLRTGLERNYNTIGAEFFVDTKWWNEQPITLGIRYCHLLNEQLIGNKNRNVVEVVLPVNLFNR